MPLQATAGFGYGPSQQIGAASLRPLFEPPFGPDHLLRDWGGMRTYLGDHGVYVKADHLTEDFDNINGNPFLMQLMADVLQREVHVPQMERLTAVGGAILRIPTQTSH